MYVVRKPLNIAGRRRNIGEAMGDGEVAKPDFFIRNGYLVKASEEISSAKENTDKVSVPIMSEDGGMELSLPASDVFTVFLILQETSAEAVKHVSSIENEDILIVLDACDTRKTVREAAKNRATALRLMEESAGDE